MVTVAQLSALLDFLEVHPDLALGRCTRSKEGRSLAKRLWTDCANILNSISSDCAQKTPDLWRVYYNEYKSKLLKKIKTVKGEFLATGGGPAKKIKLTPLQERLYNILGSDVGEPLPGVRHNPFPQIEHEPSNAFNNQDIQITEEEQEQQLFNLNIGNQLSVVCVENAVPSSSTAHVHHTAVPSTSTAHEECFVNNQTEPIEEEVVTVTPPPPPRQRRRRRRQSVRSEQEPAMRDATNFLHAMEDMSAKATLEHANATNRLAAAIEELAGRLKEPVVVQVKLPSRKRSHCRLSSDSE